MTMRRVLLLAALGGITLVALSALPGWVEAERRIVGYGSARVVWPQDAWSGFFVPWLPLGVVLCGLAGALAIAALLARRPGLQGASAGTGAAAVAAFGAVLAVGRDSRTPTPATTWTGEPGWMVPAAMTVAALLALVALASGRRTGTRTASWATALLGLIVTIAGCVAAAPSMTPSPSVAAVPDWRTDPDEPYPFVTPVPELSPTELDGAFTRPPTDTYTGDRAACRRCPPFPLDRGASVLTFDRGRYEIVHEEPAYRSMGHFTWDGEVLTLFNDPECGTESGTYRVERDGAQLRFEAVDDPCAFGQRTRDLTLRTWTPTDIARGESCQPPNTEAAVSGHWPEPSGC